MQWLIPILTAILKALLPWLVEQAKNTSEDAHNVRQTRDRLRDAIRRHWLIAVMICPLLFAGCGTRTVYVPHGTPVRLRETIPDAKVWVKDADGRAVPGVMDIPEGWYALPMPDDDE